MKDTDYQERIRGLDWTGLRRLFAQIEARDTPGRDPGKASEGHLSSARIPQ